MSIKNLFTTNLKSDQNIQVNSLTTAGGGGGDLHADTIFVNNIEELTPANGIQINNILDVNNSINIGDNKFKISLDINNPCIALDENDAIEYNRTFDKLEVQIGSQPILVVDGPNSRIEIPAQIFQGSDQNLLDIYYESNFSKTFTGPWTVNQTIVLKGTRIGRIVTLFFATMIEVSNSGAAFIQGTTSITDTRLQPNETVNFIMPAVDDTITLLQYGVLTLTTAGAMSFGSNDSGRQFNSSLGVGNSGIFSFSVSYIGA